MPRFVLEIGTEELPPRFFPVVMPQLRANGEEMLTRARLAFREVKVYGTPRRLALIAEDLVERQDPHTREERGPSAKVAFDAEGKPTKAALGFARRLGVDPAALDRRETDQGEYVFAVVREPELPTKDALAPLLPGLITGLPFPKTMRWGTGKLRFGRPIRWLLALVDGDVVEFELEGIRSGRLTRGHPVLAGAAATAKGHSIPDGMHELQNAADYEERLRGLSVIVEPMKRWQRIWDQLGGISENERASLVDVDPGEKPDTTTLLYFPEEFARYITTNLAVETVFLVEWPTARVGRFDERFIKLPPPVLIEEMKHVQSYFPLEDRNGKLLPRFIGVRDGGNDNLETVIASWENVLKAKLIDADFFYQQDLKRPLAARVEDLRGVVFQEHLGTMYDKTERIRAVAAALGDADRLSPEEKRNLDRGALLCKADLTTEVVQELSGLQGVMGREYAERVDKEPKEVWEAIGEHYYPRFALDRIPRTRVGKLLSVADKLDTLAALFAIGLIPTGSADPYALRREAAGIVRILIDHPVGFSLKALLEVEFECLDRQQVELERPHDAVTEDVLAFLGERLEVSLRGLGIRRDLVSAALAVGVDDISLAIDRAHALQELARASGSFLPTVIAGTRPINIAKGFEGGEVDAALFQEDAEQKLWEAYQEVLNRADSAKLDEELLTDGMVWNLVELFNLLTEHLVDPINRYFDDVLVMHEEPAIRRNRLALCWKLSELFRRIADFTLIVQA
jgi:glycyl-tRNA synthetase beta chain